jgi:hypothetical protein
VKQSFFTSIVPLAREYGIQEELKFSFDTPRCSFSPAVISYTGKEQATLFAKSESLKCSVFVQIIIK